MIVVKAGGNGSLDMEAVCADVAALVQQQEQVVLVHGGSHETNVISTKMGHPPRFVTSVSGHSSRYTDRETLEIFAMVVAGRINKLLVERLQQLGVNAIGASAKSCGANTVARSSGSTPTCSGRCWRRAMCRSSHPWLSAARVRA